MVSSNAILPNPKHSSQCTKISFWLLIRHSLLRCLADIFFLHPFLYKGLLESLRIIFASSSVHCYENPILLLKLKMIIKYNNKSD